jgi:hypothetical protein
MDHSIVIISLEQNNGGVYLSLTKKIKKGSFHEMVYHTKVIELDSFIQKGNERHF